MLFRNRKIPTLIILTLGWACALARAEVCTPPSRVFELRAPCTFAEDSQSPSTVYGNWLQSCDGSSGSGNYSRYLNDKLTAAIESRITELYLGFDRTWDQSLVDVPSAPVGTVCSTAHFEIKINASGQSCGVPMNWSATQSNNSLNVIFSPATQGGSLEQSYRYGAWTQSLRYFGKKVASELAEKPTLGISKGCESTALTYQKYLDELGPLAFRNQPNIESITEGKDPCLAIPLDGEDEVSLYEKSMELNPDPSALHYNSFLVKNRISGCQLLSARKKLEAAFVSVAQCEVFARAAQTDREYFIPGSSCPNSKNSALSLFQQVLTEKVMTAKCEPQALQQCTQGSSAACEKIGSLNLTYPACSACYSESLKQCYLAEWPKAIIQNNTFSLAGDYPANIASLTFTTHTKGPVNYSFSSNPCQDAKLQTKGCPAESSALMKAAIHGMLGDLSPSPLEGAAEMDSTQESRDGETTTAVPLVETVEFHSNTRNPP